MDPGGRIRRRCCLGLIVLGAAGLIGACSAARPAKVSTVTVTVSRPATTASTSRAAPVTPPPRKVTRLRGTCDTLLPLGEVDNAIGRAARGDTAFVVGVAEQDIGRLAYLNCRYAIPAVPAGAPATPGIEIGISLYDSAARAQRRLADAITEYVDHGATRSSLTISGHDAALLLGATGPGYDIPLLVLASGQRTVAVSVTSTIAAAAQRGRTMTALAALAVARTGG